ncbi:glycoside hydrolase [Paraglaciecola sp. MB-3u-78]|nr:glycoside hydrolase [Paraglaciecola sp. MB-3u-78]
MGTREVDEMKGISKRSLKNGMIIAILSISQIPLSFAGWEVTWIDRFDETGVNWDNWTPQIQANYNNEVQCYTDDDSSAQKNYDVSDDTLKIIARKQNISCPGLGGANKSWTSGRLNSKDKAEFLYGRIEARIRFLELKGGSWPAFWMLENRIAENPFKGDNDTINWPNPGAGEIDVWEWFSNDGDRYITNFFNTGNCGSDVRVSYPGGAPDVLAFHTYAIEWTADNITFFFNNTVVVEQDLSNCAQYEEPMFILLNVAMGGSLGGTIDPQLNNATMEVDYVAHCVKSDLNEYQECNESTPFISDEDNDGVSTDLDQCPNTPEGTVVDQNGCELVTQPQVVAPAPQISDQQVISLFSDSYSNIANIDYNPDWQQATQVTQIDIAGNNILKYAGLNYQGTDFGDNKQDVTNMDNVHLDYWTYNATELEFFLISSGPQERSFVIDVQQQGWQSLVIPLSSFSDVDLADIFQLKVEGNGTVYLDNIYFSSDSEALTDGDMDGVQDNDDQCANTPTGVEVDAAGCALEVNIAPTVSLIATQGGVTITSVITDAGSVTIEANVVDENQGDEHTYVWTVSAVSEFDKNDNAISFDPSGLANVQISITVVASDSAQTTLSDETTITLSVVTPATQVEPETQNSDSAGGSINLFILFGLLLLHIIRQISKGIRT